MNVKRLSITNFRNLLPNEVDLYDYVNIICGDNAQGKTNMLESIWMFTGGRSFRGTKDSGLIQFGKENAKIKMEFFARDRNQNMEIKIEKNKRTSTLNGVNRGTSTSIIGNFCAVIFSPTHLSIVKGGPCERRRFIDAAICQIKPSYATLLSKYNRVLEQRNSLLKDIKYHSDLIDTLDIWEGKLASYASSILLERKKHTQKLSKIASKIYNGISRGNEMLDLSYNSSIGSISDEKASIYKTFIEETTKKRTFDISLGFTTIGPHRDDIAVEINGKSAKEFGSQGQQRSSVLVLKLAEAELLKQENNEAPVILLDDVMSELDPKRQQYILNSIKGFQVFITCCEPETLLRLTHGRIFELNEGIIKMKS